ncbi:MAG: hypothetical protein ABIU38_22800 [Vicinamibacteraceae bacterium]
MAQTPKNPNVEQVADVPFDKDTVSPVPQIRPRSHAAGAASRGRSETPPPATARTRPQVDEEYPGPQTSSSGDHVEPGRGPSRSSDR